MLLHDTYKNQSDKLTLFPTHSFFTLGNRVYPAT